MTNVLRAIWCFVSLLTGGCTYILIDDGVVPDTRARLANAPTVQQDPRYREAARLYAKGDTAAARQRIETLLATPSLPESDRQFLRRQRALMSRAAKPAPPRPSPVVADCGPRALLLVCQRLGITAQLESLRRDSGADSEGCSLEGLKRAAEKQGLKAAGVQITEEELQKLQSPAVAWTSGNHFIAVLAVKGNHAEVCDPNRGTTEEIATKELIRRSGGILLTVVR